MKTLRVSALLAFIFAAAAALAQQPAPAAPTPAPILSAKTIFISNGGADAGLFPEPFSGDPSRGYEELYAMLKAHSPYRLVDDPSQADLVLELRLTAPYGPSRPDKVEGTSDPLPMFTLIIYDRRSHYVLWTLTQTVEYAVLQKTHDRNFDTAISYLGGQFLALGGHAPNAAAGAPAP